MSPLLARLRILSRHRHPVRLVVRRSRVQVMDGGRVVATRYLPGWDWRLLGEQGETLDGGCAPTWPAAHALGGAALAVARGAA